MRNFLNSRHTNYNEIGDKVDSFCEDCEKKWFPFSFLWWDDNKKNIAGIKRKDNGILVIDKILSLINSILSSIKDIYERIDLIEPPIISEDTVELKNKYLEVGVTDEDFQEDLNIALYEKYIYLDENKIEKPLIESTTDNVKIVALNEQGESVYVTSNSLGKVKSVNGKTGDVILKTSDLINDSDFTTNSKLNKEIQDRVSADNLKLDKPTIVGDTNEYPDVVVVDNLGNSAKVGASEIGKVKSVNGKIGDVVLKTSDLQNDSDYTTNALLNKKLDSPTTNNTNQFVILGDGSTAPKNEFGKVDTVMGVEPDTNKNVDISGIETNWTNENQRFSGLVDKSADATYVALLGMDNQGNAGKLTALGNVLESGLQTISSAQALRIGQLLNGGQGDSGAISVNLISPPIVQNRFDSIEYVLLRGANLLLNSTDMSISICDENKNVIQQIPNNQIINNSSTELIFYYNFYQFNVGVYFIKITSGVKVYYTTLDLRVVQEVENINFNEITWETMYAENVTAPSVDEAINQNVVQRAVVENGNTTNVLSSFKSSELFALGENFSIEYMLNLNQIAPGRAGINTARVFAGLGYSNTPNALINNSIIYHHVAGTYTNGNAIGINGSVYNTALATPHNTIVTIIKVGNLFRMTIGSVTRSFTLSNNSGYSMFIQSNGSAKELEQQIQITKAFKFN